MVDNHNTNFIIKKTSNRMRSFHFRYMELCRGKNFQPLSEVKAKNNVTTVLDFFGDKFRIDDWLLILESLHYDQTLQNIGIRLRKNVGYVLDNLDTDKKARMLKNKPAVFTKFIFVGLIESITNSIKCNRNLNILALEGLPLDEKYIMAISKALSINENLQSISFNRSSIGDNGCEAICSTIKCLLHIEIFSMSQCQLTSLGASYIADMIKFQKIYRYSEGWKKSLRYREVNPDTIPGLRSVIISQNPDIGDKGADMITEILKEDVWIKEIDLSDCGLTDIGGKCVLDCLEINKYIVDFKLKNNPEISTPLLRNINIHLGKEDQRDMEKIKKSKINIPKIREKVKLLEEQIMSEKNLRKQVENLNEQLHAQIMCYERKLSEQQHMEIPEGYALIKKHELDILTKERDDYKNRLSTAKLTKSRNSLIKISKIRKARSETKYRDNNKQRYIDSRSEHVFNGPQLPAQQSLVNSSTFVEKNIGDAPMTMNLQRSQLKSGYPNQSRDYVQMETPVRDKESPRSNNVGNFKGIEEAFRLFAKKKLNSQEISNRQVSNARALFMGNEKSTLV